MNIHTQGNRGKGLFLTALIFAATTAPALAQEAQTIGDPSAGRYMSTLWLIMLIVYTVAWLGIFDWIGRDTERINLQTRMWIHLAMGVGFAGAVVMLMISMALVFAGLLGLFAVFTVYVVKRNTLVGPEQKLFTREHLSYLFRILGQKFHFRKSAGSVVQSRGPKQDTTTIDLLRKDGASLDKLAESGKTNQPSEAVISVKELVESAVMSRATDIHLEPKENELQARFRIDGILHNVPSYPPQLALPMISSVKVLSDMDIAEKRKPQDGTFMGRLGGRKLDFRVATAPSVHGETMVVRILDRDAGLLNLEKLGMLSDHLNKLKRIVEYPHGMLVVSGPTGSGKSTTLYACLLQMDAYQKNIITIEDPIEYKLDNVTQTAVNPKAGVTFAGTLRSALRQDPDVIMVGEIRDAETARVACQAAMTGHFVFTTIHANDSVTTLFRFLDLGVESYFIASSLAAVLAQRLVRVLCPTCKVPYVPDAEFLKKIGVPPDREITLYKSQGCDECQGTGYKGRIGLFELLEVNDAIKDLLRTNPGVEAISREARNAGLRKLHDDGLAKVIKGVTSLKELMRVTR